MKRRNVMILGMAALMLAAVTPLATADEDSAFAAFNKNYEAIRLALLHDNMKDVAKNARAIESGAAELQGDFSSGHAGVSDESAAACKALLPEIGQAAGRLAKATDIASARKAFGELSKPMVRYREMSSGDRPVVVYCPMAKKAWLQPDGEIGNPYYGQSMAKCGDVVSK